jgi:NTP pyrophosphatase (non-canonical NTP hydrolase)
MIDRFKTLVSKLFNTKPIRTIPPAVDHATKGLVTEVGEITDLFKKYQFYGKEFSALTLKEELGDTLFYIEALAQAVGSSLDELMELMVAKHGVRYLDGDFNAAHALARDKAAEADAMRAVERKYHG